MVIELAPIIRVRDGGLDGLGGSKALIRVPVRVRDWFFWGWVRWMRIGVSRSSSRASAMGYRGSFGGVGVSM